MLLRTPDQVLDFWFENTTINGTLDDINAMMAKWFFRKSPEFEDTQMRHSFLLSQLVGENASSSSSISSSSSSSSSDDASSIDVSLWDFRASPRAAMAQVIILDQFSRCAFRGTPSAFAFDEKSAEIINYIVNRGDWLLEKYSPIERFFLCVGIQHSERLADQEVGVNIIAPIIGHGAPEEIGAFFASLKGFPHEHYDVVKRFGRFPHRNELLGRECNADEIEWLQSDECPGWAKSQKKK
jgi:uncharacterized protein (DUF924 family)